MSENNKVDAQGILSVVFITMAAGAGFSSYLAEKWISTSSEHLNVGQHCFKLENATICTELEDTTKRTATKYVLRYGPLICLVIMSLLVTSLVRQSRVMTIVGIILSCIMALVFAGAVLLFANAHFWTSSQRSKWGPKEGLLLGISAVMFAFKSGVFGLASLRRMCMKVDDADNDTKKSPIPVTRERKFRRKQAS